MIASSYMYTFNIYVYQVFLPGSQKCYMYQATLLNQYLKTKVIIKNYLTSDALIHIQEVYNLYRS